jgi:hypothetical protein
MNLISSQNLSALCLRRIAKPVSGVPEVGSGVAARQLNPHSSAGAFCAPPLPHRRQRRVTCATDGHRNNRGSIRYCDLSGPFDLSADFQKRKLLCLLTFARGVDDPHH